MRLELRGRQLAGLVQDVLGNGELADVVQQRSRLDAREGAASSEADSRRQRDGPALHPPDMAVRDGIFGVDGMRQRFDGRQVQPVDLGQMMQLVRDAAGRVPIGEVQDEREEQRKHKDGHDRRYRAAAQRPRSPHRSPRR